MTPEQVVLGAIAASVPDWLGSGSRLDPPSFRIRPREWSFEIRFAVEAPGRHRFDCVGKIPRWDEADTLESVLAAGPQSNVGIEFRTLEQCAAAIERSGDPGLTAIEPIGLVPDLNLIVTRRLDAVTLRALLRSWARSRPLDEALRRTGRWLRVFHDQVGTAAIAPYRPAIATVELGESTFGSKEFEELAARVRYRLSGLGPVPVGDLHGDVSSGNILVTPERRIALIDPNRRSGNVWEDLAHFIAELRAGRGRALSQGRIPGRTVTQRRIGLLIEGYGGCDRNALSVMVARALLERWVELEVRLSGGALRAALPAIRRHLRAEVKSVLSGR